MAGKGPESRTVLVGEFILGNDMGHYLKVPNYGVCGSYGIDTHGALAHISMITI